MGEFNAGKLFIGLCVYFFVLVGVLSLTQFFADTYGLEYDVSATGNETLLNYDTTLGFCDLPRTYIDSDTREIDEVPSFSRSDPSCVYSIGNYNQETCAEITGCTWGNASGFWWWQNTDVQECQGDVNVTSYGLAGNELNIYGDINLEQEINEIKNFEERQLACEVLGFTWNDDINTNVDIGILTDVVGGLFTYQATFSDDYWLNLFLTTMLFYLPFILLLVALYFALPFLH